MNYISLLKNMFWKNFFYLEVYIFFKFQIS